MKPGIPLGFSGCPSQRRNAQGNPWGLDYNANGDFFIEACVIPHLWHIVQGGRYERQAGAHFNPYTYDAQIKTIAKHRHYVGNSPHSGNGRSDSAGGGHAHSGLMVYQGGTWPKEYHGKLFMGNIHGHRINVDVVMPKGASYEGDRNPDFLLSHDKHFILVAIHAGPDGNVYFCDWSDKQVCHRNEVEIWDRTNGRLFRVAHKDAKPLKPFDLQKSTDAELVKLVVSDNEWMSRHARRILQERAVEKKVGEETVEAVEKLANTNTDSAKRLRALWTLDALVADNDDFYPKLAGVLKTGDEQLRAWVVQLVTNRCEGIASFGKMTDEIVALATDKSPVVRRALASAMVRLNLNPQFHAPTLESLVANPEDATDPVLPSLYWYALDKLIATRMERGLGIAVQSKIPLFDNALRRLGAGGTKEAAKWLVQRLPLEGAADRQLALARGLTAYADAGQSMQGDENWDKALVAMLKGPTSPARDEVMRLGARWGDPRALKEITALAVDTAAATERRELALQTLSTLKDPALAAMFQTLVRKDPAMRQRAIRALASFDDKLTPTILVAEYTSLTPAEKRDAVATLASRAAFADKLLDAVAAKQIPSLDIPAEALRQLRGFGDKALSAKITAVWGTVRDTPADRKQLLADWGKKLTAGHLAQADRGAGRALYAKVCQQCHTLYGVGGKVGPEITGANRSRPGLPAREHLRPFGGHPEGVRRHEARPRATAASITGIVKEEIRHAL